jgi:hypothetical protein
MKPIELKQVAVPSDAALIANVPRTTLLSAIGRGEVDAFPLAGGRTRVVFVQDVKRWAKRRKG